jgi:hypothetical protein
VFAAFTLATLLAAGPQGSARLDQGAAGINLRLTSFDTEAVVAGKRGRFTSAELLFRAPSGERLDLRFLYRGPGELPARDVTSIIAQTSRGGLSQWSSAKKGGCRVRLYRATPDALAGKVECTGPESGAPFDAVFDAKR